MHLTFLTPLAALVGVAVLVPLAAVAGRERRAARLRRALGLDAPPRLARLARAVAVVALVGLLSAAAAQPALRDHRPVVSRRDAQAFFVVDISRSMLAARGAQQPTRFTRAIAVAERLRAQLADVPSGIATMTDRVLPNLFPTSDAADFEQVAERSLAVDRPPPASVHSRSTSFGMLNDLVTGNYFGAAARHRLVVLLTDGESNDFDAGWIARSLRGVRIDLIVVRFWHPDERIYTKRGAIETGYRPDAAAAAWGDRVARAVSGVPSFGEGDVSGAARAARRLLGHGPTEAMTTSAHVRPLSSFVVAAASFPLALLLVGQSFRRRKNEGPENGEHADEEELTEDGWTEDRRSGASPADRS
jgi:hypothetical protein